MASPLGRFLDHTTYFRANVDNLSRPEIEQAINVIENDFQELTSVERADCQETIEMIGNLAANRLAELLLQTGPQETQNRSYTFPPSSSNTEFPESGDEMEQALQLSLQEQQRRESALATQTLQISNQTEEEPDPELAQALHRSLQEEQRREEDLEFTQALQQSLQETETIDSEQLTQALEESTLNIDPDDFEIAQALEEFYMNT